MKRALCALMLLAPVPLRAQPTIRQIDGAPFAATIVAAPSAGAVAFVLNARGVRNIWVTDSTRAGARQVTAFTQDDGQDLTSLAFSADGHTLYFVRGSGPNRTGENPNPVSDPAGVEQAIWRVKLDGSPAVRVTDGSSPTPSPRGADFVFARRGAVWMARVGADSTRVTQLIRARGSAGSMRWSPDGEQLAFVSNRGTHSFVGVYAMQAKTVQWMSPSTDGDQSPVWSPDGKQLAFLREPYERRRMQFVPTRTAQPWSIQVADVRTGAAREVFRAAPGRGSAYWAIVADNQLFWTADDRIVFAWEKTGWVHLYSIASAGGTPIELTPGSGEVEFVSLARDGRRILYNTNIGDIDRRHVMSVAADGQSPPRMTATGAHIAWNPVESSKGRVYALVSTAQATAHAAVLDLRTQAASWDALAPETVPSDFPASSLVTPVAITLRAADGIETHAQLFLPPNLRDGSRHPAVIFLHGGSRRQMLLGWNYGSYYHHAYAMNQALALQGYVVLSLNYRSGIGYGMEFREALKYGASGGSEYGDVVAAAKYLGARTDIDAARIGLWGGSYGGYLTAMGLTRNPELFKAGVDVHGVHDWNVGIRTFQPDYDVYEDPAATRLAFTSSPMAQVSRWRDPVLLIHGDDDRNVRFIETLTLIEQLRRQGVPVEQLVFPDEVHGFLRHESWLRAYEAALDFFKRKM
ncbi:MAG TPA: prolyl oligopeptidase family serine peptidase [Gemmatimonadaceae bacterium]|nr:prolyl oligopeptidase family serine peptidase [Gemmatimonadaceae bacterium]